MRGHGPEPVWFLVWKACVERREQKPHEGNLAFESEKPPPYALTEESRAKGGTHPGTMFRCQG